MYMHRSIMVMQQSDSNAIDYNPIKTILDFISAQVVSIILVG